MLKQSIASSIAKVKLNPHPRQGISNSFRQQLASMAAHIKSIGYYFTISTGIGTF
jgi:hypothetical protein